MFFKRKRPLSDLFSENFVDLHSHLLPGIDDGAKTVAHSVQLIRELHELGIKNFITTPHVMGEVYPNTPEIIQHTLLTVQSELKVAGLTAINIQAAAEYLLDDRFSALLQKRELLTIHKSMVLVELSYFNPPLNLKELLFELQLAGYTPLLAHPERYVFWHRTPSVFEELKTAGCKFQLNLLSLTKHYGEAVYKASVYLLKNNMVDYVGTDVHHSHHIKLLQHKIDAKLLALLVPVVERNSQLLG